MTQDHTPNQDRKIVAAAHRAGSHVVFAASPLPKRGGVLRFCLVPFLEGSTVSRLVGLRRQRLPRAVAPAENA
jgi:hypothetical protein